MALIKCKECNKQLGSTATKCPHCGTDQRNWIRKHPIFSILLFLLVIGILNNISKSDTEKDLQQQEKEKKEAKLITLSEFNNISTGMSYSEVTEIIGSGGTVLSENNIADIQTIMYLFEGNGISNANMMFQNGKLISKAQLGLE